MKASAPGKLILLGEYAVLEGAPALVMAVNRLALVSVKPLSSKHCLIDAPEIGISGLPFTVADQEISFPLSVSKESAQKLRFFATAFKYAQQKQKEKLDELPSIKIKLDTSQFFNEEDDQKLGFGSSAALTVALISALMQFGDDRFQLSQHTPQIFGAALRAHREAQENIGSGIDVAASIFGGVLKYQSVDRELSKLPFYEKLTIPPNLHILTIWTGKSASTGQFVQRVEAFKKTEPKNFAEIINRMSAISASGIEALQGKKSSLFIDAVKQYFVEMTNLGEKSGAPIISYEHRSISEIVTESGGAYKPSGAGGGDLGVAFCGTHEVRERVARTMKNAGFKIMNLDLVRKGIQVQTM